MQRLRLTFAKTAAMKYTGHLDLHTVWERTFRRARLPLAYSQGYHPQPKLQLASALPLGFTSECEIADAWMETPQDLAAARAALESAMPPGLKLIEVTEAPLTERALQTQLRSAEYRVTMAESLTEQAAASRVAELLAQSELPRIRRDKPYDLRPLVESLIFENSVLIMRLAAREGATGRPEEVLAALGLDAAKAHYHRTKLIMG
ncbi:MAG: TIGR03936 family radical SAM-associated protein [Anaerolineales bacterium]